MRYQAVYLSEADRALFALTTTFLKGRLEQIETIDWALKLGPKDTVRKLALIELINRPQDLKLVEPWITAWRLIEESWNNFDSEHDSLTNSFAVKGRIRSGEISGSLAEEISNLVAYQFRVKAFSNIHLRYYKRPKAPKRVEDLFSIELSGANTIDPADLRIQDIKQPSFLVEIANKLDSKIISAIDIANRLNWNIESPYRLGMLSRVYYVPPSDRKDDEHEPDEFHHGIAPSVKLLHAVVSRLADIQLDSALVFVNRWKLIKSPIHIRLWAAISKNSHITCGNQISEFLLTVDRQIFWDLNNYPEIAELRSSRFKDFSEIGQTLVAARVRKYPPSNMWSKKLTTDQKKDFRTYWAVRELRRIEVAGGILPGSAKKWLESHIGSYPELVDLNRVDEGFLGSAKAYWVPPNPDNQYDLVKGVERLQLIEAAFQSSRTFEQDSSRRARDWMQSKSNVLLILDDLTKASEYGKKFSNVWECFGWTHSPKTEPTVSVTSRDLAQEAKLVIRMLLKLDPDTIAQAIDGISYWLTSWQKLLVEMPSFNKVWLKIWPIALIATNTIDADQLEEVDLNTVAKSASDQEPMDLDTLNTPAGKLVGVFLEMCPSLTNDAHPFDKSKSLRVIRDVMINSEGRSGLIAKHRMIESLEYFMQADSKWSQNHLIKELHSNKKEALPLWRAIARRTQFYNVLLIIGDEMCRRVIDPRLGRETRQSLLFSLVVECLHALNDGRSPAISFDKVGQTIRSVDDEVRSHGAGAIKRFIRDLSSNPNLKSSPKKLFDSAVAPFLNDVWPQERSLATPGVSRSLADLPAVSGESFVSAVEAIERFLLPFKCWSIHEYGFSDDNESMAKLSSINNQDKANALLKLLDLTIGNNEGAVIPYDLSEALEQIRKVNPKLSEVQRFRRLEISTRRL